jgi:hypothetical protein
MATFPNRSSVLIRGRRKASVLKLLLIPKFLFVLDHNIKSIYQFLLTVNSNIFSSISLSHFIVQPKLDGNIFPFWKFRFWLGSGTKMWQGLLRRTGSQHSLS